MKEGQPALIPETFDEIRERNLNKLYQKVQEWQELRGRENRAPGVLNVKEESPQLSEYRSVPLHATWDRPQIFPYETGEGIK